MFKASRVQRMFFFNMAVLILVGLCWQASTKSTGLAT